METDPRQYDSIVVSSKEIHDIVLSYLVHNCYKDTVESFVACTGLKQPPDVIEEMEKRKEIFNCTMEGKPLKAIELTHQLAPDLLEKNKDLHFDILCLHFIELIRSRNSNGALEFARTKLTPFGQTHKKYLDKIQEIMALLAYNEPENSPVFHFLSVEYRQNIADSLNRAILASANLPSYSALERLTKQATVVRQYLSPEVVKEGGKPISLDDLLKS